jgi:hypothetical protein
MSCQVRRLTRLAVSSFSSAEFLRGVLFLRDEMRWQWFLLKKMRLGVMDWAITQRLWNMNRLILCVGFERRREVPFF